MLLVFGEILGTYIFDFGKLEVVLVLELFTVRFCSCLLLVDFLFDFEQFFVNLVSQNCILRVTSFHLRSLFFVKLRANLSHLLDVKTVMFVHFLHDLVSSHSYLIRERVFSPLQLAADFTDQVLIGTEHVLVLLEHLSVLGNGFSIGGQTHLVLLHYLLVVALHQLKVFFPSGDAVRHLLVGRLRLKSDLLIDFI